jgi:hypothetical protein
LKQLVKIFSTAVVSGERTSPGSFGQPGESIR